MTHKTNQRYGKMNNIDDSHQTVSMDMLKHRIERFGKPNNNKKNKIRMLRVICPENSVDASSYPLIRNGNRNLLNEILSFYRNILKVPNEILPN